ncbi:ribose-5-phosphate isomerase A [Buchnera aphidicola (Nipponaphis monzeni)]|uniref:Ribose-5-phosphate isomerase A n=1 Tax=Buchnera aphidicola (Nipponaphis monzeni) TaxID=2495405 RepID=A0A455TAF6_9GAMM|nr:ribose-5-phosphate isomerase RpiA [Buchnera aphidicola]BBI01324.1 ribose-5-phosphate isomerase A [Buchnera aphidicola (Nipponaphis monzeni)]
MKLKNLKTIVAQAVIDYIPSGSILGIGTGTTVLKFIKILSNVKNLINGTVSSSKISTLYLKKYGMKVFDLNNINHLPLYIDGADAINNNMEMIKGGGGALTGEKILANIADKFICIIDQTKIVEILGTSFPLPVEVIPMAKSYLMREFIKLGGVPKYRKNIITDNGNIIIDIYNLKILDPIKMENVINSFPGVVTVGLFALRKADIILIGTNQGVKIIKN